MSKAKSVGAHSICARGGLSCRKRARADMESAPTFFVAAEPPRSGRCPAWSFLPLVESEIRRGAFYMRPRRFILPQAGTGGYGIRPYVFCGGRSPARRGPRGAFLPVVRASGFILLYFIIRNLQKNGRLSLNTNRRFCRYFSGFVPKKCRDTSSWIFGCRSACVPQQNPAH